jgi:hypothetical protein
MLAPGRPWAGVCLGRHAAAAARDDVGVLDLEVWGP